jgi:hypothetical protein
LWLDEVVVFLALLVEVFKVELVVFLDDVEEVFLDDVEDVFLVVEDTFGDELAPAAQVVTLALAVVKPPLNKLQVITAPLTGVDGPPGLLDRG